MIALRMKKIGMAAVMLACLALVACASGTVRVDQPIKHTPVSAVKLVPGEHTIEVDAKYIEAFEKDLRDRLYTAKEKETFSFQEGDELTATYRFVQLDEGSRAKRYFIGFGAGKATLTIEVKFKLKDGTEVGKVDVGGELGMGVFGGEFETAIKKAADEAAEYIRTNFH